MSEIVSAAETPSAAAPLPQRGSGSWLSDLSWAGGRLRVIETGAELRLDRALAAEAVIWLGFHLIVRLRSWWMRLARPQAPRLWFSPVTPRPWYLVWSAMAWAGLRLAAEPDGAAAAFAFEDATWCALLPMALNGRCRDISKSHVASVFEQVFGYPLAIDPQRWTGPAVEKGEVNGTHDGGIVSCPTSPRPGRCYQRLVDTTRDGRAHDLRTACVGGLPVAVVIKRKAPGARFAVHNQTAVLARPGEVFSAHEQVLITRFLAAMHIDWAGLDILRDRHDGRIYIVDVNKTDVGPVVALSLTDKLRLTAWLGAALDRLIAAGQFGGKARLEDGEQKQWSVF